MDFQSRWSKLILEKVPFIAGEKSMPGFKVSKDTPVDGCSTVSCDFGALAGEDEPTSFYSIILNQKPPITSLKLFALYSVPCIWSSLEYYRCWKCRTIKDIFVNFIILLESNLWQFYLRGPSLQKSICP